MSLKLRRAIALGAGLAGILAVTMTWVAAQSPSAPDESSTAPKTTEQVYKNIKVLKGVPANQLIPAMQFISASLGVKCDHCHAQGHFDSDEKKPKETARKMMTMMFAINKDNFDNKREVTCFSCHRGAAHPLSIPVMTAATPMMAMAPAVDTGMPDLKMLPQPSELLDKYVQALGGSAEIEKTTSRVEKGNTSGFGHSFPTEAYFKAPGNGAILTHFPNGESATILANHKGFLAFPGRPQQPLEGSELEAAEMDSDLQLPIHLKTMFSDWKAATPEKIGDQDAFQIVGSNPNHAPVELYFDGQSGLLVRLVRYAESPLGFYPTQIDYADYRDTQGVKIPYKITTSHPGSASTFQIDRIEQNVPVDNSRFVVPAATPLPSH